MPDELVCEARCAADEAGPTTRFGELEKAFATGVGMAATSGKGKGLEAALVALLDHEDPERRMASALVVGDLGVDSDSAFRSLRRLLTDGSPGVRLRAAEALGTLADDSLAVDLQPLLADAEPEVRDGVRRVLAEAKFLGPSDLEAMLDAKEERERLGAVAVLGARADADSLHILGRTLVKSQGRLLEAVRSTLVEDIVRLSDDERAVFIESMRGSLGPDQLRSRPAVGVAAADVLGSVDNDGASRLLVTWASKVHPEEVRVAAAQALRQHASTRKFSHRLYESVLELIEDEETPEAVLAPLAEALGAVDLPVAHEARVRRLTSNPLRPVRNFAIHALGGLDSAPAGKALAEVAMGDDVADRRAAIAAASQTASGRAALAKALESIEDVAAAESIAQALRSADTLLPATIQQLEQAALDAHPDVSPIILGLLKQVGGESAGRVQGNLHEKAKKLKNRGELEEAAKLFERVLASGDDPEARFELGVVQLRTSRKHLSRGAKQDPVGQTFRQLMRRREFHILERLLDEKELSSEDLFYLGFVLAEGEGDGQSLGGDILTHLSENATEEAVKRRAHNKLVTMGWIEP